MKKIFPTRIKLNINFTFLILIVLLLYSGDIKLLLIYVLFSYLHEYTHAVAASFMGYTPAEISAGLFGGVLHLKEGYVKPGAELIIHSAGPLFNLSVAMIAYLVFINTGWFWMYDIIALNLILALFNLLPFYPLDGGKIVNIYIARFVGYDRSYMISKLISIIFSILLFILGLYLVQYNVINLLICALAVNLYIVSNVDNRYSFNRLMSIYAELEKENTR